MRSGVLRAFLVPQGTSCPLDSGACPHQTSWDWGSLDWLYLWPRLVIEWALMLPRIWGSAAGNWSLSKNSIWPFWDSQAFTTACSITIQMVVKDEWEFGLWTYEVSQHSFHLPSGKREVTLAFDQMAWSPATELIRTMNLTQIHQLPSISKKTQFDSSLAISSATPRSKQSSPLT